MSSTGMTTSTSSGLEMPASTMVTGRGVLGADQPPRKRATSSSGRCVADRPMRCGDAAVISSSRSSERARWAPRLVGARAWISSMMTVSTPTSVSAAFDVSIRYRLSGVVISRSGGRRTSFWRSLADVSPVRMATSGRKNGTAAASGRSPPAARRRGRCRRAAPAGSSRRRRRGRAAGEMYSTRVRAAAVVRWRARDEPIDRREEGGERLAAAGGRADERVPPGDDGRPPLDLGPRRHGERRARTRPARRARRPRAPDDRR